MPHTTPNKSLTPQQQQIIDFLTNNDQITTSDVERMMQVKSRRARTILSEMVKKDLIKKQVAGKNTTYFL